MGIVNIHWRFHIIIRLLLSKVDVTLLRRLELSLNAQNYWQYL